MDGHWCLPVRLSSVLRCRSPWDVPVNPLLLQTYAQPCKALSLLSAVPPQMVVDSAVQHIAYTKFCDFSNNRPEGFQILDVQSPSHWDSWGTGFFDPGSNRRMAAVDLKNNCRKETQHSTTTDLRPHKQSSAPGWERKPRNRVPQAPGLQQLARLCAADGPGGRDAAVVRGGRGGVQPRGTAGRYPGLGVPVECGGCDAELGAR